MKSKTIVFTKAQTAELIEKEIGIATGDRVKVKMEYTVVGLTEYGAGLYFSDDVGRFFQHVAHGSGSGEYYQFLPVYDGLMAPLSSFEDVPADQIPADFSEELQDGECIVSSSMEVSKKRDEIIKDNLTINYLTIQVPNINLEREGANPLLIKNRVTLTTPQQYTLIYNDPASGEMTVRTIGMQMGIPLVGTQSGNVILKIRLLQFDSVL